MRGTFCGPCPKSTAAQNADANAISHCVLPLDFYVLLLFEVILAAHVRTKDLGNIDAAVGVQVVLEERDEHTRGRPTADAVCAEPKLEDLYLYHFRRELGNEPYKA